MKRSICLVWLVGSALSACGGRGGSGGGEDGSGSIGEEGDGDGESNSQSGTGDGDGESQSGTGDGDGENDEGDGDGSDTKWDTLVVPDAPPCGGPGMGGDDPEFSYIWVSNSSQSTISKINTVTMIEEGRYMTRPTPGNPSRTSVSLSGDVAVANRSGGMTKVLADPSGCGDTNGMPGIQTSNNNQALAWDVEECRAWFTPMNYASQRPAAWAPGEWDEKACGYQDEPLWTSGTNGQTVDVVLLDGDDGAIVDTVNLGNSVQPAYFGIYGGAADGDGNFWGSQLGQGKLVRVDREDMTFQVWNMAASGYGMTVDSEGYVWTCSSQAARFDPDNQTWQVAQVGGGAGCMAETGEDGLLWMANGQGIVGVNRDTLTVAKTCPNTNGSYGISIDFEGNVWAVAYGQNANRVDPETCQTDTYGGLVGAYTYSDMTGYALANAGTPSG
jgi:hypothetical protein